MSSLEQRFTSLWETLHPQITLYAEYRFHPERRWRFDFAHPETKIAIEIEGGTWIRGRHNRGSGYEKDCEKYGTAAIAGWRIIRLTEKMITPEWIDRIAAAIQG